MPDWLSYDLSDAQIFSARAYDRLVERCMQDAWPAQPLVLALGLVVLVLLWRRPMIGSRALAAVSALACVSIAAWWLPQCYAELHWATGWMATGFALQAVLLAAAAAWPGALQRASSRGARVTALMLLAFALVALPWLSLPAGSSAWRAELIGLMPGPCIALALALVPLCTTPWRFVLLPLPLAGVLLEALTQASIDRPQWMLLPVEVAALPVLLWLMRRAELGFRGE
jgi:hypothetical protein